METITRTTTDTSLSLSEIIDIIDEHYEAQLNFLFVCNKPLAKFIYDYMAETYDLYDEDMPLKLKDDVDEYYVTLCFGEDGEELFFCENAKGNSGGYKLSDLGDYIDYYICLDIDSDIILDKLLSENGSWNFVEVDMDECEGCCGCDECRECNEGVDYNELLDIFIEKIQRTEGCPGCIRDVLEEFAEIFLSEEDNQEELFEEIDEDKYNITNNFIINIDNISDKDEFMSKLVDELKKCGV